MKVEKESSAISGYLFVLILLVILAGITLSFINEIFWLAAKLSFL